MGGAGPVVADLQTGYSSPNSNMSTEPSSEPLVAAPPDSPLAQLVEYRAAQWPRSLWQLGSTLVGFGVFWTLAWWSLDVSYVLTLLLIVPTAGFLVRLFILAHDCGHGSFFQSRLANDLVGFMLGVLTLTPYYRWRKHHAIHHATSGNLDRRGHGDIHTLTVREYAQLSPWQQWAYRVFRHPLVLFGISPLLYFVIMQRMIFEPPAWKKERRSVHLTNLAILVQFLGMWWLVGLAPLLLVHLPVAWLASSVGVWLFYVQHQYETTYWQYQDRWEYVPACLEGSSYYQLPKVLQWLTANIGLHHIHHLDSHIPNYRLQECFDENPDLQTAHRLTIGESLACVKLKLWDEDTARMVGFPSRS